jgi:hypothetical protein
MSPIYVPSNIIGNGFINFADDDVAAEDDVAIAAVCSCSGRAYRLLSILSVERLLIPLRTSIG